MKMKSNQMQRTVSVIALLCMCMFVSQGVLASGNGLTPTQTGYDFSVYDLEGQTTFELGNITVEQNKSNNIRGKAWKNTQFLLYPKGSNKAKWSFTMKKEGEFKHGFPLLSSGEYRFVIKVNKEDVTDHLEWGIQGTIHCKKER